MQIQENAEAFQNIRNEKFDEILSLVETFQGAVSLTEILNQEIPILNGLREAKMRLVNRQSMERENRMRQQQAKK